MYIARAMEEKIKAGATQMPVVAVVGPRQSGKSTLVRELFPHHRYIDIQDADYASFAQQDPKGFLATYSNEYGLIIDEAQYAPALFPQIKVEADKNPRPGYYVLSGSQNFLLHEKISESLAGRVYLYTLLPLSIEELKSAHLLCDTAEDQIFKGFYPRVYQSHVNAADYYDSYISTYVERDIRSIRNIDDILVFKKFMTLCALRVGSTLNMVELGTQCGITADTAKKWLSLLQASYVLFLLPSYHDNLGKRVTKSPKLFFYDVGLAVMLMNVTRETIVKDRALYGALFENMMIVDIMKNYNASSARYALSFFRDVNQKEIDLIIETGGKTIPIEIKASQTVVSNFFDTGTWFQESIGSSVAPCVVFGGDQGQTRSRGRVVSWKHTAWLLEV